MNIKEGYSVRMEGLEPPCLAALDPKSSASTNFATSAMNLTDDCTFAISWFQRIKYYRNNNKQVIFDIHPEQG